MIRMVYLHTHKNDGEVESEYYDSYGLSSYTQKSYNGTAGDHVRYVKIRIENKYPYTPSSFKVKDPTFTRAKSIAYSGKTMKMVRHTFRWQVSENAKYEIRIRRTTPDNAYPVYLTTIRAIEHEEPLASTLPNLAKVALRIKATSELHGLVDEFNCMASSILPVYDTGTQTWTDTETANPAWVFCDV